jgi:hypothetical protein
MERLMEKDQQFGQESLKYAEVLQRQELWKPKHLSFAGEEITKLKSNKMKH